MRWAGSVALVTGASRGIGRAVATQAHRRGAKVGLVARGSAELERLTRELGPGCAAAAADVGDRAALEAAHRRIVAELGPVDILVNNAGIGSYAAFSEEEAEGFERLMRVNYLGTVHATRAVLPSMIERGRGHVVNVASIAGRFGSPFEAAYSASKFAVVGLTEAIETELAPLGVRVSLVNPGPTDTSFFEARGVPYQRTRPRPLPASRMAEAVMRAVERDLPEQIVPSWIRFARALGHLAPSLTRDGKLREFRAELEEYAARARGPR